MFNKNNQFKAFESKVWLSSPTMHGDELKYINQVEAMTCEKIGCKYAVRLSCGTASLHLSMKLAGIEAYGMPKVGHGALEGKKVIAV